MAVDFYNIGDTNRHNCLFSINTKDFELFEKALIEFHISTGLRIDPYGTTRLYKGHVALIRRLLQDALVSKNITKENSKVLTVILEQFIKFDIDLLIVGD